MDKCIGLCTCPTMVATCPGQALSGHPEITNEDGTRGHDEERLAMAYVPNEQTGPCK